MDVLRQGFSDSMSGLAGKAAKAQDRPTVAVNEIDSHSDSDTQVDSTILSDKTLVETGSTTITTTSSTKVHSSSKSTSKITVLDHFTKVQDVYQSVTSSIVRLDPYNESFVQECDLRTYLHYISDERLIHMPRRGSDWDRVLGAAQFFGLQIWSLGRKVDGFVPCGGKDSAIAALASCKILLEIGHGQAQALLPTFMALYELAMLLSSVGQIQDLEYRVPDIKRAAAVMYSQLISLTGRIAVEYRRKIDTLKSGSHVHIDFDATFGTDISQIWQAKEKLHDHIWASSLGNKQYPLSVSAIRRKLQPMQLTVRSTLFDEVAESLERSEDTCHWIQHDVLQFLKSKDQALAITGAAGTGKTILAEWIQERLARPLDRKTYSVLDYTFAIDSPAKATGLACVQSLLNQLLESNVGDVDLYELLVASFTSFSTHRSYEQLEESLWQTLRQGIQAATQANSVVIITDGCDQIRGGEDQVQAFRDNLRKAVSGMDSARIITFARNVSSTGKGEKHIKISHQVREDIRTHLFQSLSKSEHFNKLEGSARDELIETLVGKSQGNFLWAYYAGRLFQMASSSEAFSGLKQTISQELAQILQSVLERLPLKKDENLKYLLSFMLVSERPLAVEEVQELLATSPQKRAIESGRINAFKYVAETCGDFVVIRSGTLHFRSSIVREFLEKKMETHLLSWKAAQRQLLLRGLLYARVQLDCECDVRIDGLDYGSVEKYLGGNSLLLYVVQNWTSHLKASGFIAMSGDVSLPKEFEGIFPSSVLFGQLERACWPVCYYAGEIADLHELSLKVREASFGRNHVSVLQTLITLGHVHRSTSVTRGASYIFQAVKLGQIVLSSATHAVVSACTSFFLTWTETITITTRTEIVTYREEMIRVMITICKARGASREVVCWYEKLAQLYITIKEEHTATIVYRELYEFTVRVFGPKDPKAREIGRVFGTLDVVLRGDDAEKDVKELEVLIFETNDDMNVSDHLCISMMIRLAQSYVGCGKFFLAERLFVSLWRRISIICTTDSGHEIHCSKIQIALAYVRFLHQIKRYEEANSILICLWSEYEHYTCEVESLLIWIREIGTVCKSFGLLSIAISVLTKVWGWFKGKGKGGDDEAQKTTILITEVVEEITETTVTTKTTKTTTTEVTETVVKEIFEHHFTRCKKTTVDKAFFSACMALIGLYIQDCRWSEAEVVITRTLEITWKAVLSAELKISITEHSVEECILIARRLAVCYHGQGFFEKAEQIYLRIYYACLYSSTVTETTLTGVISVLIGFYEEHHRHEKIIEVYVEVLEVYRKRHGHGHRLTINILYLLADQCETIGHKDTYKYYLEIVTVLNKGITHCHHDAIKAAVWICGYYYNRKSWTEFRTICGGVWETFVGHREGCVLEVEVITKIHKWYTYVLEFHAKVDFSVLYKVTVQYKEVVGHVCGGSSMAFILALIELAKICEKMETHHHESVTIYEEVIKKITTTKTTETTTTETTVSTVKKRLSKMYVTIITSGKAGSTTTTTLDRAIEICLESYYQLKIEFGCWHETTLLKLRDVIFLYTKLTTKESHVRIIQLLQTAVTEIITTVTVTATLFAAATTLASIYVTCGNVNKAHDLLHQLRHLIIFRGSGWSSTEITLKLDATISRSAFAFLLAFEQGLCGKGKSISYSVYMANLVYESVLYEEYTRVIEKETRLEVILECGAKLRGFWEEHKRSHLLVILDKKLLELFKTEYGVSFKGINEEHVRVFYLALLAELGTERHASSTDFAVMACKAGISKVRALLDAGDFFQALHVGRCVFHFARKQQLYRRQNCVQYGYKLSELLAGIDVPHPSGDEAKDVSSSMLVTSRDIMAEVLAASRAANMDFAALRFEDLTGLIRLLGAQRNFAELEAILSHLWSRREALQRSSGWSPTMVLQIGKLLVHAQQGHGHTSVAINTAELLYYNVRRGRGRLDPETMAVAKLLSSLYISADRVSTAVSMHDGILREIASNCQDDEGRRVDLASEAKFHLDFIKNAHNLKKADRETAEEFRALYSELKSDLQLQLPAWEQYTKTPGRNAAYSPIGEWKIARDTGDCTRWERSSRNSRPKSEIDVVRAAKSWWLVY